MQSVGAHIQGVSTKSQLFNSLKLYLNNKNRLQPIIGLCSIIECVRAGTHSRETLYLCEVCVCRHSKVDIRNHIMGSLHRYNYIKTRHPHLVTEWQENADLSNLAWPLMEKAKILEGNEGPGEVQMLEVEDAIYQRMATLSENEAVNLINVLREELCSHSETTSMQPEDSRTHSRRVVFFHQDNWRGNSAETNGPSFFGQSAVALSDKSVAWLDQTSMSLPFDPPDTLEKCVSKGLLDGDTGTRPLIGMKQQFKGWTNNSIQKRKISFKGPVMPGEGADMMMSRKKMRKLNDTVFKVSLPLTKGSVLLERTSFSKARRPFSALYSFPPDSDPLSESQSEFGEGEFGEKSLRVSYTELPSVCTTSQIQQDPHGEDADSDQHMGPNVNFDSHYQEVDGCLSNDEYWQSEYITRPEDPMFEREEIIKDMVVHKKDQI